MLAAPKAVILAASVVQPDPALLVIRLYELQLNSINHQIPIFF